MQQTAFPVNTTLSPIQSHQPVIQPTVPQQSNISAPINLKLFEPEQLYQPERNLLDVNETPENQTVQPGNMFGKFF